MKIKLGIPLKISEIAYATSGKIINSTADNLIECITTDSRECKQNDLFIAIKGQYNDGNVFCNDAEGKGAYCLSETDSRGVKISNGLSALANLASYYKSKLVRLKHTIAVTGSVGKSTTKNILTVIFSKKYKTHATRNNYNSEIGAPMTVLSAPPDTEALILELGMNHRGEISRLSRSVTPDIAIITNVGTAHIGNLGSREQIALAKLEILEGMKDGKLIVPASEPLLNGYSNLTFGLPKEDALFSSKRAGADVLIFYRDKPIIKSRFSPVGDYLLSNLSAAVAAALCSSVEVSTVENGISCISGDISRQSVTNWNNILIYDDSYNASYESVVASLDAFDKLAGSKRSILLGSMLELGEESEKLHRLLGKFIATRGYSKIYLIGDYSNIIKEEAIKNGFPEENIFINTDAHDLNLTRSQIKENSSCGEALFLKASNALNLSDIYKKNV